MSRENFDILIYFCDFVHFVGNCASCFAHVFKDSLGGLSKLVIMLRGLQWLDLMLFLVLFGFQTCHASGVFRMGLQDASSKTNSKPDYSFCKFMNASKRGGVQAGSSRGLKGCVVAQN